MGPYYVRLPAGMQKTIKPQGRGNHGNTCWFNSVCQLMLAVPVLMNALRKASESSATARDFLLLIENPEMAPYEFISSIMNKNAITADPRSQLCSNEYLDLILQAIHKELPPSDRVWFQELSFTAEGEKRICKNCKAVTESTRSEGPVAYVRPLTGWSDAMNAFKRTANQNIEFVCSKCNKNSEHCSLSTRRYMGEVIFVVPSKNEGKPPVEFAVNLLIDGAAKTVKYELVAIAYHGGSVAVGATGGHWQAYVKSMSVWYNINDSTVTVSTIPERSTIAVYVRLPAGG